MKRSVVINPGSSKWWLLTLTPLLYYDQIRVSKLDIEHIYDQENKSYYYLYISKILQAVEKYSEDDILIYDESLPFKGENEYIKKNIMNIVEDLLYTASIWSPNEPTFVNPSEIKEIMINAYKEWIQYNKQKFNILPPKDPLKSILNKQILESENSLRELKNTLDNKIVDLLYMNKKFYKVFYHIIRNAYLIITVPKIQYKERLYDTLIYEFLPAIQLLQKYFIVKELSQEDLPIDFQTMICVYNIKFKQIMKSVSNHLSSPEDAVLIAIKERKRFQTIRIRLAEIDSLIQDECDIDERWLREFIALIKDLHKIIQRIDKISTICMWFASSYLLKELLSTFDFRIGQVIKFLLANPLTTKKIKEIAKDLYLASKGIRVGACPAIAAMRDYLGYRNLISEDIGKVSIGNYEFWV